MSWRRPEIVRNSAAHEEPKEILTLGSHSLPGAMVDFLDEDGFSVEPMVTGSGFITISTQNPHLIPKEHR